MVQGDHFSNFIDWLATFTEQHPPGSFHILVDLQYPKPPDEIAYLSAYLTLENPLPRLVLVRDQLDSPQMMRLKTYTTPFKKLGWGWNDSNAIYIMIFHYFIFKEYDRFCLKQESIFYYFPLLSISQSHPLNTLDDVLYIWEYSGGDMLEVLPANLKNEISPAEASKFLEALQPYIQPKISTISFEPPKVSTDAGSECNEVNVLSSIIEKYKLTEKQVKVLQFFIDEKKKGKTEISQRKAYIEFHQNYDILSDRLRDTFRWRPEALKALFKKVKSGVYSLRTPF